MRKLLGKTIISVTSIFRKGQLLSLWLINPLLICPFAMFLLGILLPISHSNKIHGLGERGMKFQWFHLTSMAVVITLPMPWFGPGNWSLVAKNLRLPSSFPNIHFHTCFWSSVSVMTKIIECISWAWMPRIVHSQLLIFPWLCLFLLLSLCLVTLLRCTGQVLCRVSLVRIYYVSLKVRLTSCVWGNEGHSDAPSSSHQIIGDSPRLQ